MSKVNVYLNDPNQIGFDQVVIARVKYNECLDYWDGRNHTNGGIGMHKGITKLRKPIDPERPYVIIIGSQWQGGFDYAYCVDAQEAVSEICRSGKIESDWLWPEIKQLIADLEDCEE